MAFYRPLQSNKVKDIAPFIHLIHSIDSLKLLAEVNKQAKKHEPHDPGIIGDPCGARGIQARTQS